MRVASHSERQPTAPAVPEPAANAVTEHEFDDAYEGAYVDEGVDQSTNFSRVWGPVWYGDCETACRPNCGPRCAPRWWVNAEYLLWFQRGTTLPPLVTTSFQGTTLADAGVLGLSTTSVLYGDQTVGNSSQSGGRLTVGMWLDDCEDAGFGGRGFMLDTQNDRLDASSGTVPILARPYFDVSDDQMSQQNSLIIAYPGVQTGQVNV